MFGNRSGQRRPRRRSDPLASAGFYVLILGGVMFALPTYFHQSWLLTSWLGSMQAPIGLALVVVGAAFIVAGLIRGGVTPAVIPPPPLDPSIAPPPPGPVEATIGHATAPTAPAPPRSQTSLPTAPPATPSAAPLGAGIDVPPPPLEPIYRPPTSLDDLGPSGPG